MLTWEYKSKQSPRTTLVGLGGDQIAWWPRKIQTDRLQVNNNPRFLTSMNPNSGAYIYSSNQSLSKCEKK
jgi:hypothetical protein